MAKSSDLDDQRIRDLVTRGADVIMNVAKNQWIGSCNSVLYCVDEKWEATQILPRRCRVPSPEEHKRMMQYGEEYHSSAILRAYNDDIESRDERNSMKVNEEAFGL